MIFPFNLTAPIPPTLPSTSDAPLPISSIRLSGGRTEREGNVQVSYNGSWSYVCDDSWSKPDAAVACNMLGFPGALKPTSGSYFGSDSGTIIFDQLDCAGNETSLWQCGRNALFEHDCGYGEYAGVVCHDSGKFMTKISRLSI